jgi:hypothetical protein
MASSLQQAIEIAREKAYVILDGSLVRKDQVAMSSDRDQPFYPCKHETGRCRTPCRGLDAMVKRAVVPYCPEAQRWDRPGSPGASFRQVPCSGSYSSRSKTYMSSPSRMSEYGLGPEPRTWP